MPLAEKLKHSRGLIPVVLLIGGVIGSIYSGIASPTDAATVGVVLALAIIVVVPEIVTVLPELLGG